MHVTALPPERHPDAEPRVEPPEGHLWRLAHSRPGRCSALARDLAGRGVPYYRAMGRFASVWKGGRKVLRARPLFPNYVFIRSDLGGRSACRRSLACLMVEDIDDQEGFRRELASLDALFASAAEVQLGPAVAVGERVRVVSGMPGEPVGLVRRLGSRGRLYVELACIGQTVSVELDLSQVEPLHDRVAAV